MLECLIEERVELQIINLAKKPSFGQTLKTF